MMPSINQDFLYGINITSHLGASLRLRTGQDAHILRTSKLEPFDLTPFFRISIMVKVEKLSYSIKITFLK
uniref:Uncharacterized protein n=1 Tax=Lepeophtheirus salmonis TaxID=72036 RepID=A0A0K2TN75_LEPSM